MQVLTMMMSPSWTKSKLKENSHWLGDIFQLLRNSDQFQEHCSLEMSLLIGLVSLAYPDQLTTFLETVPNCTTLDWCSRSAVAQLIPIPTLHLLAILPLFDFMCNDSFISCHLATKQRSHRVSSCIMRSHASSWLCRSCQYHTLLPCSSLQHPTPTWFLLIDS